MTLLDIWNKAQADIKTAVGETSYDTWLANLKANPEFTLHLRNGDDVSAHATEITDPAERDRLLTAIRIRWGVDPAEVAATNPTWVATSPLVAFVPQ